MKKKALSYIKLNLLTLLFVGIGFVACTTEEVPLSDQDETSIESSDDFAEINELLEQALRQGAPATTTASAKSADNLELAFSATILQGQQEGTSITGTLSATFSGEVNIPGSDVKPRIFFGTLDLDTGETTTVAVIRTGEEQVGIGFTNPSLGRGMRALGTVDAAGTFSGQFRLLGRGPVTTGEWSADPIETELPSIGDIISNNPDLSIFTNGLETTGVINSLRFGEQSYTAFVPTNEALEALDTPILTDFIFQHLVPGSFGGEGTFDVAELLELGSVTTNRGIEITIEERDGKVFLNGNIEIITKDIRAKNGVVHIISGILLPSAPLSSLAETISNNPDLSSFKDALEETNLLGALGGEGGFTVFAPTNEAFEALETIPGGSTLRDILSYHLVPGSFGTAGTFDLSALSQQGAITTVEGSTLSVSLSNGTPVVFGGAVQAEIIVEDIATTNGFIHIISEVLLPPAPPIADIISDNPELSTFNAALETTGLINPLRFGEQGYTAFVPTNNAFEALGAIPAGEDLRQLVIKHLVPGGSGNVATFTVEELLGQGVVTTAGSTEVTIEEVDGKILLNGTIELITQDLQASNGVVHIIEGLLIP